MQLRHIDGNVRHLSTNVLFDNGSSTAKERDEAWAGDAQLHAISGRYRQVAAGLALSDALCVVVALMASYALRYPGELMPAHEPVVIALAPLVWIVVFYAFNLYAPQHLSAPEELRRVIGASGVGIVVLAMGSFWSKSSFSRAWVGLSYVLVLLL